MNQLVNLYPDFQACDTYISYKLNEINNATTITLTLTFHIIGICPQRNMPVTLHTYVSLH